MQITTIKKSMILGKTATLAILVVLSSCEMKSQKLSAQQAIISVTNTVNVERNDALIILKKSFLQSKLGTFSTGKYLQVKAAGNEQVVQLDDLDGDGNWDEALLLYNFKPQEKINLQVSLADKPATIKAVVRTHVRQMHKLPDESFGPAVAIDTMPYNNAPTDFAKVKLPPYLTEGPAWENDKIGFRKYFDTRNANDIWGKVTSRMVLDEVGVDPTKVYHNYDPAWGMDILRVGKSLGAGAIALQFKLPDGRDTLVRPGSNALVVYRKIADGPIRALFDISYENWKPLAGMQPISVKERISIWGGQYFFQNEVSMEHCPANTKLVTGLIDFYTNSFQVIKDSASITAMYSLGKQSENHDELGLAILLPTHPLQQFGFANASLGDIQNTYKVSTPISTTQPVKYRYMAVWQQTLPAVVKTGVFDSMVKQQVALMGNDLRLE